METDYQDFKQDNMNSYDDLNEESYSYSPSNMDGSTFKIRNDTEELLFRIRLDLMNAFKEEVIVKDSNTGENKVVIKIRRLKGVTPMANKQGISEIMGYVENYINGHTVQTNFLSTDDMNRTMLPISNDIVKHYMANREKWKMTLTDCDIMIGKTINLVEIFLRRGIHNEERKSYSESHKETVHRDIKDEPKEGFLERWGKGLVGLGGKK